VPRAQVALDVAVDGVELPLETAIPCGLVLGELIANALLHGFAGGRAGSVRVALTRADARHLRLSVHDDGAGLPEGFDLRRSDSLGLRLVCALADQLHAPIEVDRSHGTAIALLLAEAG
jgi:two-component sensor histidine kinase